MNDNFGGFPFFFVLSSVALLPATPFAFPTPRSLGSIPRESLEWSLQPTRFNSLAIEDSRKRGFLARMGALIPRVRKYGRDSSKCLMFAAMLSFFSSKCTYEGHLSPPISGRC